MSRLFSHSASLWRLYAALIAAGGIVAHLASEFAAMGRAADDILFSSRHLYLAVGAALLAFVVVREVLGLWRAASSGRDLKRLLRVSLERLPFGGRGLAFFALTGALQFGIGLATEIGEGCPFCGHDIVAGVLGALLTVVLIALAGRAIARRLPSIGAAVARILLAPKPAIGDYRFEAGEAPTTSNPILRCPQLFSRPPPLLQP